MFSFLKNSFKKLINFQKTDTSSVEKDERVELKSNDESARLENIKLKDTDLNKRLRSNENYQSRSELAEFRSSFPSFHSNETASRSSESNLRPSFDDPINVVYKSQRKSSKLAAKKIAKIADRLSMQSDEEMSDEDDDKIEKSIEQKVKSSEEIKLIKRPHKMNLHQSTVRFCQQCKTHKIIVGNVSKRKYCDKCKNILFYLCSNCKKKLYASHKGWKMHESICDPKNAILKLVNVQNESILHQPSDHNLNEKLFYTTGRAKKHDLRNIEDERKTEAKPGEAHNKQAVIANKQIKMKCLSKWIKRYCETCQKTVKLTGISKIKYNTKCKNCSTLLQFQCIKCHAKYKSNTDINYHFQSKCYKNYKCSKCNFNSSNEKSLTLHFKIQHPIIFQCDLCTYQSSIKANLKRHIECIHLQKLLSCQICSFTTPYLQNLRRHEQTSHSFE